MEKNAISFLLREKIYTDVSVFTYQIAGQNIDHRPFKISREKGHSHIILVGVQNGITTVKRNLGIFYKIIYSFTFWFSNQISGNSVWRCNPRSTSKHTHKIIHCDISKKLET